MRSFVFAAAIATLVASAWGGAIGLAAPVVHDTYAYPQYRTSYGVADRLTGDQKAAVEVREGGVTKGTYSLVQPDGVVRTVNYIVTPLGGFQAQVINKGVAGHPAIVGIGKGIGARGLVGGFGLNLGSHIVAGSEHAPHRVPITAASEEVPIITAASSESSAEVV